MEILEGKLFEDFHSVKRFVDEYEKKNHIQLTVVDSRKLETWKNRGFNHKKLSIAKDELVYTHIHYKCLHGREFKSRGQGLRKTMSFRQNCPFDMKLGLSKNAQHLVIKKYVADHNHDVSETLFSCLPKQRKSILDDNGTKEFYNEVEKLKIPASSSINLPNPVTVSTSRQVTNDENLELKDVCVCVKVLKRKARPQGIDTTVLGLKKKKS